MEFIENDDILRKSVPHEVVAQLSQACDVIERHLSPMLLAVHLYGSALNGGLKPSSDVDLLVTLSAQPDEDVRQALLLDLLEVSAPPGQSQVLRSLEVTAVVYNDIVPWRYPPRRELQFGEWLRKDILAGIFEPAVIDPDLTILLMKARKHGIALIGPPADQLFDPIPEDDLFKVMVDTLKLWNSPPDWAGDERNVVLTLARVWYTAATGEIVSKDAAATWAIKRLPVDLQPVLLEARQVYLGVGEDRLVNRGDLMSALVRHMKREAGKLLNGRLNNL